MAPIAVRQDGPVRIVTLADAPGRNTLSHAALEQLEAALLAAQDDQATRAVVIDAQGPVFSAGHDLRALQALREAPDGAARIAELFTRCANVMRLLAEGPLPTIAAIEGVATAAGCQLAASCDLAIAGGNARFATPGVAIGLFCSTPAVALTRVAGRKAAMEMLLTGDMVTAGTAAAIGLVNRVVPAGDALCEALALARRIGEGCPAAIAAGKATLAAQRRLDLSGAYEIASQAMARDLATPDAGEGIDAFLARRQPRWGPRPERSGPPPDAVERHGGDR